MGNAPVAQLDRASASGAEGCGFDPRQAHVKKDMTVKERWLRAVKCKEVDRLLFWPKLNSSYLKFQEQPFRDMKLAQLHSWIGSDKHESVHNCIKVKEKCVVNTYERDGEKILIYKLGGYELTWRYKFDPASESYHPVEFPVKTSEDIKILTAIYEGMEIELDEKELNETRKFYEKQGDEAVVATSIGTTALMGWVQHIAGIENAHYFLFDYYDDVVVLFDVMDRLLLKKAELISKYVSADLFYLIENTSSTIISPAQYSEFCLPTIYKVGDIIHKNSRLFVLHMCGLLKALLGFLAQTGADAFEAFTSPPVGDCTLNDGRKACPDVCLIGGTNASLWMKSKDEIIDTLKKDLDALPHHRGCVITSGGVMPPLCKPETIKAVCEWVMNYKVKMR